jgi:hypothetical protein
MRVISQDGTMDMPYDSSSVSLYAGCINGRVYVRMQICGYDDSVDVADYSTKEKAKKAMEMLRIAYENNVFYHCTAGSKCFEEVRSILSEEQFQKATTEYFQFPAEEELE